MAHTLYAYTSGKISLYVSSHQNEIQAQNAADKAVGDGYVEIPDSNSGPNWMVPFANASILCLYIVEEIDPGPNAVGLDPIAGVDIV